MARGRERGNDETFCPTNYGSCIHVRVLARIFNTVASWQPRDKSSRREPARRQRSARPKRANRASIIVSNDGVVDDEDDEDDERIEGVVLPRKISDRLRLRFIYVDRVCVQTSLLKRILRRG